MEVVAAGLHGVATALVQGDSEEAGGGEVKGEKHSVAM